VGAAEDIHFVQVIKKTVSGEDQYPEGYCDYKKYLVLISPILHTNRAQQARCEEIWAFGIFNSEKTRFRSAGDQSWFY
jgi:hypothetical protein